MPDRDELPALSDGQFEIMNVIWERSECSVAEAWKVLNERRKVARNTVHTLMTRLEEKGWLSHRESDGGLRYRATVSQDEAQRQSVRKLIETAFQGSAEGLVLTLLGSGSVSKAETDRIRKAIESARRKKP